MQSSLSQQFVDECHRFLKDYCHDDIMEMAQRYPKEQRSLVIDYNDMVQFSPNLADDYTDQPDQVRAHLLEALQTYDLPVDIAFKQANVRIKNLEDAHVYDIGEYVPDTIGNALGVRGQVSQVTDSKPELDQGFFECLRCGTTNGPIIQAGEDVQMPHECQGCERQGPFRLIRDQSTFTNSQLIRIQRPPEMAGGSDTHLDVRLKDDLANAELRAGSRVEASGTLAINEEDLEKRTFDYYLDGDDVKVEEGGFEDIDPNDHREIIEEIKAADDPVEVLKESFAPHISRDEKLDTIMEALILQMVGTFRKDPERGPKYRGDSHVLLLGDPGTTKSEMLEVVEELSPRAKLKSGEGITKAGITAAATKDDFGDGEFSLKAGLMVLASGGIACLDEVDKANEDALNSAHQALENQRVSVMKGGIEADLPAKTALLAAGNPKYGRFDQYEPIGEQIDLTPALMSRFDLMFMISDEPEPERDREIAETIVDSWAQTGKAVAQSDVDNRDVQRDIPENAFTAYIAECKQKQRPVINDDEVNDCFVDHYLELRQNGYDEKAPVPVTARKLEAFLRLAESSARARFSDEVEQVDVDRAYRLVRTSMEDVGMDPETGEFDADMVETGKSMSQKKRIKKMKTAVKEVQDEYYDSPGAPVEKAREMAKELGISKRKFEEELESLRSAGEVYEPQDGFVRLSKDNV